jgi:hypothetical protein
MTPCGLADRYQNFGESNCIDFLSSTRLYGVITHEHLVSVNLTAVTIFWDVMPCSLVKFHTDFSEKFTATRKKQTAITMSLLGLTFDLEDGGSIFLRNVD